jgi:hypothetical protein
MARYLALRDSDLKFPVFQEPPVWKLPHNLKKAAKLELLLQEHIPAREKFPPPPHEVPEPQTVPFEKLPRKAEPAPVVPQRSPASAQISFRLRILNLLAQIGNVASRVL